MLFLLRGHNIHNTANSLLQIVPEVADEIQVIKIWQDLSPHEVVSDHMQTMYKGPTSARMKIPKGASAASIVEHIDGFLTADLMKKQQETDENTRNMRVMSVQAAYSHIIRSVAFEGSDIRAAGVSDTADSIGLKTGVPFQVEYSVTLDANIQHQCCTIA
jgi:hypothetical protein